MILEVRTMLPEPYFHGSGITEYDSRMMLWKLQKYAARPQNNGLVMIVVYEVEEYWVFHPTCSLRISGTNYERAVPVFRPNPVLGKTEYDSGNSVRKSMLLVTKKVFW